MVSLVGLSVGAAQMEILARLGLSGPAVGLVVGSDQCHVGTIGLLTCRINDTYDQ